MKKYRKLNKIIPKVRIKHNPKPTYTCSRCGDEMVSPDGLCQTCDSDTSINIFWEMRDEKDSF